MKRTIAVWIVVFCLLSVAYFLWISSDIKREYDDGDIAYEEMRDEVYPPDRPQTVSGYEDYHAGDTGQQGANSQGKDAEDVNASEKRTDTGSTANSKDDAGSKTEGNKPKTITIPDMEKVSEINNDLVAWITCPDTVIDYPVAHGEDNIFYLTHLANGKKNANGCLFIDCNNAGDFSDYNTIIYGHNMHSGKMFATLLNYKEQDFYDKHRYMYLTFGDEIYRLELFSAYVTTPSSDAYRMRFQNNAEYAKWLEKMAGRSDFKADIRLSTNDRIVTLSTCAYDYANARYVVHGRLVKM